MRVTMTTSGSRGDVEPLLALGQELMRRGHEVVVCTEEVHEKRIRVSGMGFVRSPGDAPEVLLRTSLGGEGRGGFFGLMRRFAREVGPLFEGQYEAFRKASEGADVVVFTLLGLGGLFAARHQNIPALGVMFAPAYVPTKEHPSAMSLRFLLRGMDNSGARKEGLRGLVNTLSYYVMREMTWQMLRPVSNRILRRHGEAPEPFVGGTFKSMSDEKRLQLYAYSREISPEPEDWPPWCRTTGYWYGDHGPLVGRQQRILDEFLANGEKSRTVAVGFGSMKEFDRESTVDRVLGSLRTANLRGVVMAGWGGLGTMVRRSKEVLFVDEVAHDYLYPRVGAVVFHGGSGTVGAVARAGVPSVVVPHFADQFYWAYRLHGLGCSPPPIPKAELTEENLTAALVDATTNDLMKARSARLGERIRGEPAGQKMAADVLEEIVRRSRARRS